jgi:hypothetical protein
LTFPFPLGEIFVHFPATEKHPTFSINSSMRFCSKPFCYQTSKIRANLN